MKTTKLITGFSFFFLVGISGQAQSFINLGFESANVAGYAPGSSTVPTSSAFPGWQAFYGSTSTSQVWFDGVSAGGVLISIINDYPPYGLAPIQGNYSADLYAGAGFSASLSQTGLVPAGTQSLTFDAYVYGAPFVVTLGGQVLNATALQAFSDHTVYGVNLPQSLVDQSETLTFTEPPPAVGGPSELELDDISFSPTPVPEPSILGLTTIGGLIFGARKYFARRCEP